MRTPFVEAQPTNKNSTARAEWADSLYKAGDLIRKQQEPDWYVNAEFLKGNQWITANPSDVNRVQLSKTSAPQAKAKITSNQIMPLFRKGVASLAENFAVQVALPSTSDDVDKAAADLATLFLRSRMTIDDEQELRTREMMAVMMFGRCLRKTVWNPNKSSVGLDNKTIERSGDIETTFLDPSQFVMCPWDRGNSEPSWVIEADIRDVDEVNALWPGNDVQEEGVMISGFNAKTISDNLFGRNAIPQPKRAVLLKQLYIRGTDEAPNGKYIAWANGKILQDSPLPDNIFPFVCLDWLPIPLEPYPMSFISALIPMQRELNITLSQLIEVKNRQLRGDIAIKGGRGKDDVIIESMPNGQKVVRIDPSVIDWKFLEYEAQTQDAQLLMQICWDHMMQNAGVHESSLGQQSKSNVTATQVLTLKESDLSGLAIFRTRFDIAYCKVAQIKLRLAQLHYKVARLIKVTGENEAMNVKAFIGADLRNTQDVIPQTTPLISDTLKHQMRQEADARTLFGPYQGPQDKYAKLIALQNSGIPDIQKDIDTQLGGMSMDELHQQVLQLEAMAAEAMAANLELQTLSAQAQTIQIQMQMQPAQEEEVPVDQNGDPAQPGMEEQAAMQMMEQQAAQAQQQNGQQGSPQGQQGPPQGVMA